MGNLHRPRKHIQIRNEPKRPNVRNVRDIPYEDRGYGHDDYEMGRPRGEKRFEGRSAYATCSFKAPSVVQVATLGRGKKKVFKVVHHKD